jgi:CubicO group peptidase (beta-lactamase class C family)
VAISQLNSFLHEQVKKNKFSGNVLIAKNGTVLYQASFGKASKRFNVDNNLSTKFNLGSMNKMFTAVAIMQLVQNGQLKLTNTLDKYADDTWLPKSISEKIQIRHLLTHSSGLNNYFNRNFMKSSRRIFRKLDDFKPLVVNDPLQFEPGTNNRYSNTGMLMLGVVIEKVTGQSYFDYIDKHIYQLANMPNSASYEMDQPVPNLAIGYEPSSKNDTGWINNLFMHVVKGGPAGGGFSTLADMHQFSLALTNYKLLNKALTEQIYSAKPALHSPNYGYGFNVAGTSDNRIIGHRGGFPGILANLDIHLDSGFVSIVLSNYGRSAQPVVTEINRFIAMIE